MKQAGRAVGDGCWRSRARGWGPACLGARVGTTLGAGWLGRAAGTAITVGRLGHAAMDDDWRRRQKFLGGGDWNYGKGR
jgi:hypothetical protein